MSNLDLDAIAAAAREADGEASDEKTVTFAGETFRLVPPDEIDFLELGEAMVDLTAVSDDAGDPQANIAAFAAIGRVLSVVFAPGEWERFRDKRPGPRILGALAREMTKLYDMDSLGESLASSVSPSNTGNGSKPTSNGSTGSTPAGPSSDALVAPV